MSRPRNRFGWVKGRLESWAKWELNQGNLGARVMDFREAVGTTNFRNYTPSIGFAHEEQQTHREVKKMDRNWRKIVHFIYIDHKKPREICGLFGKSANWVEREHELVLAYLAGRLK